MKIHAHHEALAALAAASVLFFFSSITDVRSAGTEISRGASMEEVHGILGKPQGEMKKGRTIIWIYSNGNVEFEKGVVIKSDMFSRRELDARAERMVEAEQREKEAAKIAKLRNEYQRAGIIVKEDQKAGTYTTTSFVFYCPLDRRQAVGLAAAAQAFHDHIVRIGLYPGGFPEPLKIYYNKTVEDTIRILKEHGKGELGIEYGRYYPDPPAIYTQREMVGNSLSGIGTLYHEIIHRFNHLYHPKSPPWFNEGTASFIGEQTRICANKFCIGYPNPWREVILRDLMSSGETIDIGKITLLSPSDFYGRKEWYVFVRALYFWLYDSNKLTTLMRTADKSGYSLASLENAMGMTEAQINAKLTGFIQKKCYPAAYYNDACSAPDRQQALLALEKALAINPDYDPALILKARHILSGRNHEESEKLLRAVIKQGDPRYITEANSVLGDSLLVRKQAAEALECYMHAWEYSGYDEMAYFYPYWIGVCYETIGDKSSAARWYKKYLEDNWQADKEPDKVDRVRNYLSGAK